MKLSIVHRLVRHIATYHFLSCFVIFLVVEVNGVSGRSDLRTKLLLQNIRSHLAQKVDEIVHQKECESGLTLCKNIKNKEEGDEEKSEEIPPPPKIARGAHKPLIKVSPKDVIQTLMPKAHKRKVQKEVDGERHKKFLFSHLEVKPSEESDEEDTSEPIQEPEPIKTPEPLKTPKPVKVSTDKKDKPIESPIIKPQKPVKVELKGTPTPREAEKKPQVVNIEAKKPKIVKLEEKNAKTVKTGEKKPKNVEMEEKKPKIAKIERKKEKEMKDEKPMVKKKIEKIESEEEEDGRGDASLVVFGEVFIYALDSEEVEDKLCRKHSQIYQKQLKKNKIWALMMYDASAKLPSGILQGNVNQYGDFDECLSINAVFKNAKTKSNEPSGIKGKYCLANVDLSTNQDNGAVLQALERAESFNFIKSTIYDPGHFIPRFSSINWGLCVPSACPAEDVERFMKSRLEVFNKTSGLLIDVHVEEDNCVVKDDLKPEIHLPLLMTILFYFIVISMSLCATYMDRKKKGETEEKRIEQELQEAAKDFTEDIPVSDTVTPQGKVKSIVMAFSLKRTLEKLFSDNSSGNIDCINGIKSVFTVVLYFAHKTIQLGMSPYTNRILLTKISNEPATVPLRTSIIYTDSFLLISGVLTSYNLSKEISEKGKISWVRKSIARFIRLTPALLAVVLFYAYVWDHLGSGPTWNLIVRKNSELCQKFMWRNLLYIQNFFAFENMCAPQTHQLALDMQLSMLSPLFVYLLHTYDKVGIGILQALFLVSSIIRYITASNNNLSVVIYHGMSVSQLYRTANLLYGQSLHRASPYILGTIVGYYLKRFEKTFQMPKAIAALGWIIAFSLGFYSVVSPSHMAHRGYQYDVQEAAQYAALSPVAWALALSWLIAACHLGYGGKLNEFLCQRIFLVFSRISYSVYLTQFLVFFYKIGVKRVPEMFSFTGSVNITEFLIVISISVIVTLLFDIPMMEVKRIILDKKRPTQKEEKEAVENEETREPEQRPPLQEEYETYSRGDLQDEINTIREAVIEEELEQEEEGEQEQEHEGEQEEEELEDEEEEEEVEEGDEEDTGEVGSEEDEAEESEEMEEEEDDLEVQPLRRSTTFHFDEPEDKEWFKVEPETTEDNQE